MNNQALINVVAEKDHPLNITLEAMPLDVTTRRGEILPGRESSIPLK